ncbi:MAG: translation initiation factor IF-2 associated domain-containing protein, partial [Methylocystis sp.]
MSETENSGDKTLTVTPSKTLHLKQRPSETGMVSQRFSHGRTKTVVVETVKRHARGKVETKPQAPVAAPTPAATPPTPPPAARHEPRPQRSAAGVVLRALTDDEREARARALVDARGREEEDRRRAEVEAKARAEREAREREERAAADARKHEEEARLAREADFKRKSEEEARRRLAGEGPPVHAPSGGPVTPRPTPPRAAETSPGAETKRIVPAPPRRAIVAPAPVPPRPTPSRGGVKDRGRLTVATATAG